MSAPALISELRRRPSAVGESIFANVITFSRSVMATLMALDAGDSVAISGTVVPCARPTTLPRAAGT